MDSLTSVPALRALTPTALAALAGQTRAVRLPAGAVLRPAGETAGSVLLLLSGTVVATHTGTDGAEVWPEQWTGPAIVDKPAVLGGGRPPTGLMAVTAIFGRQLGHTAFLRLLDREATVREHVLARMARDALAARLGLARAATLPAVARVALWLTEQNSDQRIAWRGSQEHLARLFGLSRVTMNRVLARLARAGAVELTPHGVVIADRTRLSAFAGG